MALADGGAGGGGKAKAPVPVASATQGPKIAGVGLDGGLIATASDRRDRGAGTGFHAGVPDLVARGADSDQTAGVGLERGLQPPPARAAIDGLVAPAMPCWVLVVAPVLLVVHN